MLRPCKSSKVEAATCFQDVRIIASDRISELPDEILHKILSRLTLRDATRTSVLSSRWKHIYSSSQSSLVFSWVNMFQTSENIGFWETVGSPCCCREYKVAFIRSVNQFLDSYRSQGTKVRLFEISFCLGVECQHQIDNWVKFAFQMGAEDLKLNLRLRCEKRGVPFNCDAMRTRRYIERNDDNKYVIPSYKNLSRRSRESLIPLRLKYLCLRSCKFQRRPKIYRLLFSQLVWLELNIQTLDECDLKKIFSYLGNLKCLRLKYCTLPRHLCLGPLKSLQSFLLLCCPGIEKIRVPLKLTTLDIDQHLMGSLKIEFVDPSGSPASNIASVSFCSDEVLGLSHAFTRLPKLLPNLSTLRLRSSADWANSIPESVGTFKKVTQLRLVFKETTKFGLSKMISILEALPLLQRFHMMLNCPKDDEMETVEANKSSYVHEHLERITFCGFYSTPNQIEFCIYMLQHAPCLKQFLIYHQVCNSHSRRYVPQQSRPLPDEEGEEHQKIYQRLQPSLENVRVVIS